MASTTQPATDRPEHLAAAWFMARKGFPDLEPWDVERLEDQDCWYFAYDLPNDQGQLELEVSWNGRTWDTLVTTFAA